MVSGGGVKNVMSATAMAAANVYLSKSPFANRHAGPGPGSTTAAHMPRRCGGRRSRRRSPSSSQPTNQPEPQYKWPRRCGGMAVDKTGRLAGWRRLGWEILTIAGSLAAQLGAPYLGRHHDHGRRSCEVGGYGRRHCHPV